MTAAVDIQSLSKRYGRVEAVADVSLRVEDGESFGYLGPNGAGKTTTIRCMLGFIRPSAGTVRIFGNDIARDRATILADVGYLPGEFGLWASMTGREALEYLGALHPSPPAARAALLDRFELSRADLDRPLRAYSRGMKQKVGIVQAFQHEPRLVVLDEPTEGLDPLMKARFVALLREHRARGGTIFMSSHILSEVELATDRVAVIKQGKIVRVGSPRDLSGERVRRCTVTFRTQADPQVLALPGVSNLTVERDAARFEFRGDMGPLIERIAAAGVVEFLAEPESLMDAFFEIYGELA